MIYARMRPRCHDIVEYKRSTVKLIFDLQLVADAHSFGLLQPRNLPQLPFFGPTHLLQVFQVQGSYKPYVSTQIVTPEPRFYLFSRTYTPIHPRKKTPQQPKKDIFVSILFHCWSSWFLEFLPSKYNIFYCMLVWILLW